MRALLHVVERDLDHELRAHVHDVAVVARGERAQLLGRVSEHRVGRVRSVEGIAPRDQKPTRRITKRGSRVMTPMTAAQGAGA